ncbi:hypothetical protein PRZ48_012032 [Zasmidium cellare]|uniref:Uncharacterized protein n=1 Tax=Zasmidium cellare TaxID=395010 RepID=A0ABR0E817_ZASCE|nr:hypothetical protein PRZ48_012032 [Zasmidium cellare]
MPQTEFEILVKIEDADLVDADQKEGVKSPSSAKDEKTGAASVEHVEVLPVVKNEKKDTTTIENVDDEVAGKKHTKPMSGTLGQDEMDADTRNIIGENSENAPLHKADDILQDEPDLSTSAHSSALNKSAPRSKETIPLAILRMFKKRDSLNLPYAKLSKQTKLNEAQNRATPDIEPDGHLLPPDIEEGKRKTKALAAETPPARLLVSEELFEQLQKRDYPSDSDLVPESELPDSDCSFTTWATGNSDTQSSYTAGRSEESEANEDEDDNGTR